MQGKHFVLVTGWSHEHPTTFTINDPGFDRATYDLSDIVGWRIFDMKHISSV
jgi:hypothetical protein